MVYFRNKFNEEFLFLCNEQTPKGGTMRLDQNSLFFYTEYNKSNSNQPSFTKVIPLLLFNKIMTSNSNDHVIEDLMVLCENKNDTTVTCLYDENYVKETDDYLCNFGITTATGDLL